MPSKTNTYRQESAELTYAQKSTRLAVTDGADDTVEKGGELRIHKYCASCPGKAKSYERENTATLMTDLTTHPMDLVEYLTDLTRDEKQPKPSSGHHAGARPCRVATPGPAQPRSNFARDAAPGPRVVEPLPAIADPLYNRDSGMAQPPGEQRCGERRTASTSRRDSCAVERGRRRRESSASPPIRSAPPIRRNRATKRTPAGLVCGQRRRPCW